MRETEKYCERNVVCRLPLSSSTTESGRYLSLLSLSLLTLRWEAASLLPSFGLVRQSQQSSGLLGSKQINVCVTGQSSSVQTSA